MEEDSTPIPSENENSANTPKKRGRKPKNIAPESGNDNKIAKRRGRPKKIKEDEQPSLPEIPNDSKVNPEASSSGPIWRDVPAPAETPQHPYDDSEAEIFVHRDEGDDFSYGSRDRSEDSVAEPNRADENSGESEGEIPDSFSTSDEDLIQDNYGERNDDSNVSEPENSEQAHPASENNPIDDERGEQRDFQRREQQGYDDRQNRWQRNRGNNRFQQNNNRNGGRYQQNNNNRNNQQNNGRYQQNNNRNNQQNRQNQPRPNNNQQNRQNQRGNLNQPNQNRRIELKRKPRWMQNQNAETDAMNPADLPDWDVLKSPSALQKYLEETFFGKKPENNGTENPKTEESTSNNPTTDTPSENVPDTLSEIPETQKIVEDNQNTTDGEKNKTENKEFSYWDLIGSSEDEKEKIEEEKQSPEQSPVEDEKKSDEVSEIISQPVSSKKFEIEGVGEISAVDDFDKIYKLSVPEIRKFFDENAIEYAKGSGKSGLISSYYSHAAKNGKLVSVRGVLDVFEDGFGGAICFPSDSYALKSSSVYVPQSQIDAFKLKRGHIVEALSMPPREGAAENCPIAVKILDVMGGAPADAKNIVPFTDLTPYYPTRRIIMEADSSCGWDNLSMRVVDLLAPIGFGQRALIVAPPRTGKTVLMQGMAKSIRRNAPNAKLIILLVDERPEEVTDFRRNVDAEVVASTFDEDASSHVHAAEMVISKARRMVEKGEDVVILLDSITRLARAYNAMMPNGGRTMSGGVEANALQKPKKFFGSARNIEGGGSLTIIGTALVETGSKMDDVIFEEFKGTGNLELHLDRSLSDKRIFPSINMEKSGTRKEEMLYHPDELPKIYSLRRAMKGIAATDSMEMLIQRLKKVKTNVEFLMGLNR